eukprot:scaffold2322_cov135-Cylindrotheca_fusiformis.AAC.6
MALGCKVSQKVAAKVLFAKGDKHIFCDLDEISLLHGVGIQFKSIWKFGGACVGLQEKMRDNMSSCLVVIQAQRTLTLA